MVFVLPRKYLRIIFAKIFSVVKGKVKTEEAEDMERDSDIITGY